MPDDHYSFIVRIWFEAADGDSQETAWRGSIERVGSQGRSYFQDLAKLCHFIQAEAGLEMVRPSDIIAAGADDNKEYNKP